MYFCFVLFFIDIIDSVFKSTDVVTGYCILLFDYWNAVYLYKTFVRLRRPTTRAVVSSELGLFLFNFAILTLGKDWFGQMDATYYITLELYTYAHRLGGGATKAFNSADIIDCVRGLSGSPPLYPPPTHSHPSSTLHLPLSIPTSTAGAARTQPAPASGRAYAAQRRNPQKWDSVRVPMYNTKYIMRGVFTTEPNGSANVFTVVVFPPYIVFSRIHSNGKWKFIVYFSYALRLDWIAIKFCTLSKCEYEQYRVIYLCISFNE